MVIAADVVPGPVGSRLAGISRVVTPGTGGCTGGADEDAVAGRDVDEDAVAGGEVDEVDGDGLTSAEGAGGAWKFLL